MYKLLLLLCLILTSPALFAQNLLDIYNLALQQDAQLRIAESEYLAATEALPVASSAHMPQINLSAHVTSSESDLSSVSASSSLTAGSNTTNSYGYTLSLLQNIYNAETIALVDVAEAQVAKAEADLEASRQDLVIRVAESYFDILAAEDNLEFAIAEKNAIGRQLEQAQKRFEVGLIAITDVHEAQARYDSAVAQELLAKNLLDNAFQALQVIIAEAPDLTLAQLGEELELDIPAPEDSAQWVEISLKNNRSLISSLATLNAAKYAREQLAGSDTPTLDFIASYTDTSIDDDSYGEYDQGNLSLQIELNVPLYTGGRISAQKQQAESEYQAAKDATLLQRRLTSQQTRNAYLGVVSGISQVMALRQALSSSTTALEATEAGFEVGTRTSVDVLVSLRETYAAQRDYASARYDYLINILKLKQASGLLDVDDLIEINQWLIQ
ncbi:MAG: TolC family outer membrane protein [Gammaproteobacteria bacterium]|nr:TolC family outer membrane protein [Gammaproteobacteria bacterium]